VSHLGHDDDRLSAFLDDELEDREALRVTRHLARCGACRDELEELRRTRAALRGLPAVEPPLSFMVESVVLGPGEQPSAGPPTAAIGMLVAASVLLVTAFALGGSPGAVTPDVEQIVGDHVESVGGGPVVVPVMLDADDR
jgi:anti-sigma factor RsiW